MIPEAIAEIPPDPQGAYLLFQRGKLVCVGKSDAEAGIRHRLGRHHKRVQVRENISPAEISFKARRICTFSVMDVEALLTEYLGSNASPGNNSGFGPNDPGRKRDNQEPSKFDKLHPLAEQRRGKQCHDAREISTLEALPRGAWNASDWRQTRI